jgi:hypothetical protein
LIATAGTVPSGSFTDATTFRLFGYVTGTDLLLARLLSPFVEAWQVDTRFVALVTVCAFMAELLINTIHFGPLHL